MCRQYTVAGCSEGFASSIVFAASYGRETYMSSQDCAKKGAVFMVSLTAALYKVRK